MASWQRVATHTGGTVASLAAASLAAETPASVRRAATTEAPNAGSTTPAATETPDAGSSDAAPDAVVFAATPVGVFRSTDAGRSWSPTGRAGSVPSAEVVVASASVAHGQTLFVGGQHGLLRSTDAGRAWQPVLVGSPVLSLAQSAGGLLLAGTATDGVLRSEDDGRTWDSANAGLVDLEATALALSPDFEHDHTGFVGTPSGLYRTRNSARAWRLCPADDGDDDDPEALGVQCLAVSPDFALDRLVLAGTLAGGLLRSDDAGQSWAAVPELAGQSVTALAFGRGRARGRIAAATACGIASSDDGGASWQLRAAPGPTLSLLWTGDGLLAGQHRLGVVRSTDGAATWEVANVGLHARLLQGLLVTRDGALVVSDLEGGLSASLDGGRKWSAGPAELAERPVLGLAEAADGSLVAATPAGLYGGTAGGAHWSLRAAAPARVVARSGARLLAGLGDGHLLASDDAGRTWQTLHHLAAAEIVGLAATASGVLVVASVEGQQVVVWRGEPTGGGWQWRRWLAEPARLPVALAACGEAVWVGLGRRVLRAAGPAAGWQTTQLAGSDGLAITALAAAPDPAALVAATSTGVYVARDGGARFALADDHDGPGRVVAVAIAAEPQHAPRVYALGLGGTLWSAPLA